MFIPFLAASAVSLAFIELGAMSVQVSVLTLVAKASLVAIAVLLALLVAQLRRGQSRVS